MNDLTTTLQNNPIYIWIGIISTIIGVPGTLLGIFFYFRGKRDRKLCYRKRSYNVISKEFNAIEGLEMKVGNDKIETLTISKIAIWNAGREAVEKRDLAPIAPIKIACDQGTKIYGSTVIFPEPNENAFKAPSINNEVILDFDHIGHKEGCVIRIAHSGTASSNLQITGKVKSGGKILAKNFDKYKIFVLTFKNHSRREKILTYSILLIFGLGVLTFAGYVSIDPETPILIKIVLAIGGLFLITPVIRTALMNSIPPGFEQILENNEFDNNKEK